METDFLGREAFQEVDLAAFYAPITKWAATVNRADRLAEFVARGLRIATSGRPGPVMLALPADVLAEEVAAHPEPRTHYLRPGGPGPGGCLFHRPHARSSSSPRSYSRRGGRGARQALISFAEALGAGVYAAFRRQDVFPNEHPNYLGHLTLGTPPETLRALEDADLVLVAGSRLSEVTTQSYALPRGDQAVIQVDGDPDEVGATVPVERGMVSDATVRPRRSSTRRPSARPCAGLDRGPQAYLDSSTISPPPALRRGSTPRRS